MIQELEESAEEYYVNNIFCDGITEFEHDIAIRCYIAGAKWQQEQIGKSEFLQKLRGTLSDAEARRLIFETFKTK